MLNSSEANNSMFGKDVLDEYGIKREENGEYVMNNQPNEKERQLSIGTPLFDNFNFVKCIIKKEEEQRYV